MTLFLAAIDSILGVVVFLVISVLAAWLQKKQREGEQDETAAPPLPRPRLPRQAPGAPPPPPRPTAPKPVSWEEELEKLLRGEIPGTEPPPPPPPPPVTVPTPRRPVPAPPPLPPSRRAPEEFSESTYHTEKSPVEVKFKPLPQLTESVQAYQSASGLEKHVESHLREATQHQIRPPTVQHAAQSKATADLLTMLRSPRSAQSAMMASFILNPPPGLSRTQQLPGD